MHGQFQSSFSDAFKCRSQIFNETVGLDCGDAKIVDVLSALVGFFNTIQIFLKQLEKADRGRLSPCASRLWAKVVLANLKASNSMDFWSAIGRQW